MKSRSNQKQVAAISPSLTGKETRGAEGSAQFFDAPTTPDAALQLSVAFGNAATIQLLRGQGLQDESTSSSRGCGGPTLAGLGGGGDPSDDDHIPMGGMVMKKSDRESPDNDRVGAAAARGISGAGGPLPHLDRIQASFGQHDVTGVQAHTGGGAAEANTALGAQAYATGGDVAFGTSSPDLHLAAHEAAHIVQQRDGVQLKNGMGEVGDTYERHADAVADLVVRGESAEGMLGSMGAVGGANGSVAAPSSAGALQAKVVQFVTLAEAKTQVEEAASGMGTDEDAIFEAIRTCDDRPGLAPQINAILEDELSGHELWRAQLLLRYGRESAWPKGLLAIFNATEGSGTDEEAIYTALQELNATEIAALRAVPGITNVLDDELSGDDRDAADEALQGNYNTAIQNHKTDVASTTTALTSMRAPTAPQEQQNTAEFLAPAAGGQGRINFYVTTQTHDAADRAKEHNKDPNEANFWQKNYPDDTSDYDVHISSERNIRYIKPGVVGERGGNCIWVHDPRQKQQQSVIDTIVHECQHWADRHDDTEEGQADYMSPENAWARYRTEFRAYSLANFQGITDATGTGTGPWDNLRQQQIHDHLYQYYAWHKPHYDANSDVYGQAYQDLVHGYTHAESVNAHNSPRIDEFYDRLRACSRRDTDLTQAPLAALQTAAQALTATDHTDINGTDSQELQEMMKDHLEPTVLTHIATICNGGTLPAWVNVNIAAARTSISEAGEGIGTDEESIYTTIRNATPDERAAMKQDTAIQRVIRTEMSGHDLWKAHLLIEYGTESQWPATVTELWEATEGSGTDEARIRTALEALTRPQVVVIANIPGLKDIMQDELSGQDETTVNELLSGAYADKIAEHQGDMQAISGLISAGLTSADATWQARCTKLNDPAKALIHAMTLTHNSSTRADEAGEDNKDAYFGASTAYPQANDNYPSEPTTQTGIRFVAAGVSQESLGMNLYVYGAAGMAQAALQTILETFADTLA